MWRSRLHVTCPDQALACLVTRQPLESEHCLYLPQLRLVEAEEPREFTIGDRSVALEQTRHGLECCLKTPLSLCPSWCGLGRPGGW
jgi:hypothetical protein